MFVDANIFIYHFAGQSEDCSTFLARIERGELHGYTDQIGILEAAHHLMMLEAIEQGVSLKSNPAAQLAQQPRLVRRLSKYCFSIQWIPRFRIEIFPLPEGFVTASQEFRQSYGLLVNDSLIPMHMREAGLSVLAPADAAFDQISGLQRFHPSDV